jgi:hypothetical protein
MDISNIPKTFWHSLSLSIVFLTFGFLFLAYKSASVSIETANMKITLHQAFEEAKSISKEIEREYEQLENFQNQLQSTLSRLQESTTLQENREQASVLQEQLQVQSQMLADPRSRRNIEVLNNRIQTAQETLQKVQ